MNTTLTKTVWTYKGRIVHKSFICKYGHWGKPFYKQKKQYPKQKDTVQTQTKPIQVERPVKKPKQSQQESALTAIM